MSITLLSIVGARPQFIKAAAISRALSAVPGFEEVIVHTGQHYDQNMSDVFFEELEIPSPHYHLGIGSATHGIQTGRMLEALEHVLLKTRRDWVLVYGDTNSTLAGVLAAVKLHIPTAHIEAGLRSYNREMPEEINRVLTDHASDLLFAPTQTAVRNLVREGTSLEKIHLVGDVMYDVALYYAAKADQKSSILQRVGIKPEEYILVTIHRAENTDVTKRIRIIFEALKRISRQVPVIIPMHPRTRAKIGIETLAELNGPELRIISPVGYLDMIMLEKHAALIATDSGGVQKEAYFYQIPCVTLRHETEWVELVDTGWNRLLPPIDASAIVAGLKDSIGRKGQPSKLYGDGKAAHRILQILNRVSSGSQPSAAHRGRRTTEGAWEGLNTSLPESSA